MNAPQPAVDLDHLTPGPWHPLAVGGHWRSRLDHPDDCPSHRCHLGRIFDSLDEGLDAGEYEVRASSLGIEHRYADGTAIDGRPLRPDPLPLDQATADRLADVADEAVNAYNHRAQCGCDTWPTVCASGYQPGTWDTGAWHAALPALLAAWEQMRADHTTPPAAQCSCAVLRTGPGRHLPECPVKERAA